MYAFFPFCLIATDSPVFWSEERAYDTFNASSAHLFDSNHKTLLITYHQAYVLLHQFASNFIYSMIKKGFRDYQYLLFPFTINEIDIKESLNNFIIIYQQYQFLNCKELTQSLGLIDSFEKSFISGRNYFLNEPFRYYEIEGFGIELNFVPLAILGGNFPFENEHKSIELNDKTINYRQHLGSIIQQLYNEIYFKQKELTDNNEEDRANGYFYNFFLFVRLFSGLFDFGFDDGKNDLTPIDEILSDGRLNLGGFRMMLEVMRVLNREDIEISPVLEIMWIKKLYPYINVIMREYLEFNCQMYHYNEMTIDYSSITKEINDLMEKGEIQFESLNAILTDYFGLMISFIQRNLQTKKKRKNRPKSNQEASNEVKDKSNEDKLNHTTVQETTPRMPIKENCLPQSIGQNEEIPGVLIKENEEFIGNSQKDNEVQQTTGQKEDEMNNQTTAQEKDEIEEEEEEEEAEEEEEYENYQRKLYEKYSKYRYQRSKWIEKYYALELYTIILSLKQAQLQPNDLIAPSIKAFLSQFDYFYHPLISNNHWSDAIPNFFKPKNLYEELYLHKVIQTKQSFKAERLPLKLKYAPPKTQNCLFNSYSEEKMKDSFTNDFNCSKLTKKDFFDFFFKPVKEDSLNNYYETAENISTLLNFS